MIKKKRAIISFGVGAMGAIFLSVFSLFFKSPLPDPKNLLIVIPFFIFAVGFVEEGIKFLLVKRWGEFPYYCLFLGLGYAFFEQYVRNGIPYIIDNGFKVLFSTYFWIKPSFGFFMQIVLTFILAYFIKKNKSFFGLTIATLIHAYFDILIYIR